MGTATVVVATNSRSMPKLDGAVTDRVYRFFETVRTDHTAAITAIDSVDGATDHRVRVGRVDADHRAIMFRVDDRFGDATYIYLGTWPREAALPLAAQSTLRVNPVNGVLEGIVGQLDGRGDRKKRTVVPDPGGQLARMATETGHLTRAGLTATDLTERLGFDEEVAARALAATDRDSVAQVAQSAEVTWQQTALLDLAAGRGIDDIRAGLSFTDTPVDSDLDENEQILAALEHPATRMQFTMVDDNDELRRVLEEGDFKAWRTFLHPEQRRYADKNQRGPFRLSGGAGTGKTVVLLHRTRNLARRDPNARIVLTTFNKTLAAALVEDLVALDPGIGIATALGAPGVFITGLDSLASSAVRHGDQGPAYAAVLGAGLSAHRRKRVGDETGWTQALSAVGDELDARLRHKTFLAQEYTSVVLGNEITTLEEYVRVPRAGRGVRVSRAQRMQIWRVIEEYRRQAARNGTLTYPEAVAIAAAHLRLRAEAGYRAPADHVVIDEGQDLHASHWRLLRALAADGPDDLFIAEDPHQRIYGQPVVLSRLGINIRGARSSRLTLNYRTTAQNLHFAVGLLEGGDFRDLEEGLDTTAGYTSARLGPDPTLLECASPAHEIAAIAERIGRWMSTDRARPGDIAVLTRTKADRDTIAQELSGRDVPTNVLDDSPATADHVQVLTMHRAKGMEFRYAVLARVGGEQSPVRARSRDIPEEDMAEAQLRERSLLYVAASRARDELVVTWSGTRSGLLP
ncbi:3'-5' exonuclease [Nocardia takedensis]